VDTDDDVVIRPALPDDLASLVQLGLSIQGLHAEHLPELFTQPDPESLTTFFRDRLHDDSHVLVAARGSELVGYLYADVIEREANSFKHASSVLYIQHIAIASAAQRQHLGSRLMDSAVELGRQRGVSAIRLDSWSFNTTAHAFFASQGFSPINVVFERPLHDGPGPDAPHSTE
jgi:ribosomal protein S18 acetylase RimI-like enzyme